MKLRCFTSLALCVVFTLGAASLVRANVWNVTSQFSAASNPNGQWSYGWFDSGFTTFTLFTENRNTVSDPAWYNSSLDAWVWINNTGSTSYGVPNGWLSLAPGTGSEAPIARWTAQDSGTVRVVGQYLVGDSREMDLMIFTGNATTPKKDTLWTGKDAGSFDFTVSVAPNDTLNFAIYGGYSFGNTPLEATISTIPEPVTVGLLLGAGTLVLVWRRSRRR